MLDDNITGSWTSGTTLDTSLDSTDDFMTSHMAHVDSVMYDSAGSE